MCRSTPTALTHSQLSSQPHTGACTRTSSWYLLSWCLCLFLLSSPFPLRYLRPWVLSCCFPAAALLSFNLCQQGRVPVWWCLIPWEPQRLRVGHEGSPSRWLCAVGMSWDAGVSFSSWVLFSPAPPWVGLQNLPLQVAVTRLHGWAQRLVPTEAMHRGWCCGVGHGCCFGEAVPAGLWGLYLCVSSLTPLPLFFVLLFCLNGADALVLGELLSSFRAFGFGVYCFFFPPPRVNRHSRWQPV